MRIQMIAATAVCLIVSVGAAAAADLGRGAPVYAPQAQAYQPVYGPAFNWTGGFVGAQLGYGWGSPSYAFPTPGTGGPSYSGFLGGLHAGYNYQLNNQFVVGLDTSVSWSGVSGTGACNSGAAAICKTSLDWYGDVRGRIGYALDKAQFYGAGGFAFGSATSTVTGAGTASSASMAGWTLGAGLDYAVTNNVVVGAEYKYVDLGSHTFATTPTSTVGVTANIFQIKAAYKF